MKHKIANRELLNGFLLYLPAIVIVAFCKGYPIIQGFYLSLTRPETVFTNVFSGLDNYRRLFTDPIFYSSLLNVAKSVAVLPLYILVPLAIAFLLNQRIRGWKLFRATYLYSYLLAPVMVGYIFSFVLGINGPLNTGLRFLGLPMLAIPWFGNSVSSMWMVLAVVLWSWFGLGTLVYLAGMASVDEELYDSAKIDGARPSQMLVSITLPHIIPTLSYWGVICSAGLLIWLFPFLYALTGGGPGYASMMPEYYIYLTATKFIDPGYASALGFVLFVVIAILSSFQVRMMFRRS